MNKKQLTIYHKGAEAYKNNKTPDDCPYKRPSDSKIWMEGFNDALLKQTCDNPE